MPESSTARYSQDPDAQTTIVQRAWPMPPGQDTGPRISTLRIPGPVLDVRRLRHPSEPSRFALAASASILLVGAWLLVMLRLSGFLAIGGLAAILLVVFGSAWWVQQVRRAKLLGGTARATPGVEGHAIAPGARRGNPLPPQRPRPERPGGRRCRWLAKPTRWLAEPTQQRRPGSWSTTHLCDPTGDHPQIGLGCRMTDHAAIFPGPAASRGRANIRLSPVIGRP